MNRVFSISIIAIILLSQGSYVLNLISNIKDAQAGVFLYEPNGYVNNYIGASKTVRALIEVIFAGMIFYAVYQVKLNNITAALSLFLLFSTLNQFVDRFFNPSKFEWNELIFMIAAIITSIWVALKWKIHIPTFGKESERL